MTTKTEKLKNGITHEQRDKAKEILSQVNVSELCRKLGIPRSTINHVLDGTSKKTEQLMQVIRLANQQIRKNQNELNRL